MRSKHKKRKIIPDKMERKRGKGKERKKEMRGITKNKTGERITGGRKN